MIVVAVRDIFFAAKISETASHLDKTVTFVATADELRDTMSHAPELVIADLNAFPPETLTIAKKAGSTVVGYLSHVQRDLRQRAEKVCDAVITQSELTEKLPELLRDAANSS